MDSPQPIKTAYELHELVKLARGGDWQAQEELWLRLNATIQQFRKSGFKYYELEDIRQETLKKVLLQEKEKQYLTKVKHPLAYLRKIFMQCAIDHIRKANKGKSDDTSEVQIFENEITAHIAVDYDARETSYQPDERYEAKIDKNTQSKLTKDIRDFIERQPIEKRVVFELYLYDEKSYDEIMETTGLTFGQVNYRINSLRTTLIETFNEIYMENA